MKSDNISIKQVSAELNVSISTVRRLTKNAHFPQPYRIGGKTFFSKKVALDSFETLYTYVIGNEEFFERGPRPEVGHRCSRD